MDGQGVISIDEWLLPYCKVGKSQHKLRDEVLSTKLIALFHQFRGVYGSERLMKELHKIGEPVGIHRVRCLMAENELIRSYALTG